MWKQTMRVIYVIIINIERKKNVRLLIAVRVPCLMNKRLDVMCECEYVVFFILFGRSWVFCVLVITHLDRTLFLTDSHTMFSAMELHTLTCWLFIWFNSNNWWITIYSTDQQVIHKVKRSISKCLGSFKVIVVSSNLVFFFRGEH